MVACEPIKSGTLLLVSKAATAVFNNKIDSRVKSHDLVECLERSYNSRHSVEAVTNLVYRMSGDPELARRVYSLYAGPEFTRDPLESSVRDKMTVINILFGRLYLLQSISHVQSQMINHAFRE